MRRLLAVGVALDEEVDDAGLVAGGDGGVGSEDGQVVALGPGDGEECSCVGGRGLCQLGSFPFTSSGLERSHSHVKGSPLTSPSFGSAKRSFFVL